MTRLFDPWYAPHVAHRTPDDIDRCLRESVAAIRDAEPQPTSGPEPYIDADTRIRGGKSRAAVRTERRPVQYGPFDEYGYDRSGSYSPSHDGRW